MKLRRTVLLLTLLSLGMFGFSFALVPLYNVFCSVTGLNGKVDVNPSRYKNLEPTNRYITVEFDTNRNHQIPCDFAPEHAELPVAPGKLAVTSYYVKNRTNRTMIIQTIPSISPGFAAKYLKKLECFCFDQQTLAPGQAMQLPLRFWLEPDIPTQVHRLTLSYTVFDVTHFYQEKP